MSKLNKTMFFRAIGFDIHGGRGWWHQETADVTVEIAWQGCVRKLEDGTRVIVFDFVKNTRKRALARLRRLSEKEAYFVIAKGKYSERGNEEYYAALPEITDETPCVPQEIEYMGTKVWPVGAPFAHSDGRWYAPIIGDPIPAIKFSVKD
jgi:hypothetical protein